MADLRQIQEIMRTRTPVVLRDGRTGRIVRVDTSFPNRMTVVSVWTDASGREGPGLATVDLDAIVGPAPRVA